MSGLGKWSLGIGLGLIVVAVLCSVLKLIPAAVIIGVVGLVAVGMAGYDAIYYWLERVQQRRRAARSRQEREAEAR
jgi:xanthosine utilization system XapX-like protein